MVPPAEPPTASPVESPVDPPAPSNTVIISVAFAAPIASFVFVGIGMSLFSGATHSTPGVAMLANSGRDYNDTTYPTNRRRKYRIAKRVSRTRWP